MFGHYKTGTIFPGYLVLFQLRQNFLEGLYSDGIRVWTRENKMAKFIVIQSLKGAPLFRLLFC